MSETRSFICEKCGHTVYIDSANGDVGDVMVLLGCAEDHDRVDMVEVGADDETTLLGEIVEHDRESVIGGYYVAPDRRDEAERLVDEGKVVRMQSPAGASPVYVPMDSVHYTVERLARMQKKQSVDTDTDDYE